jgi:hypothetical protein
MSSPVFVESDDVTGMLLFMVVVKRFVSKRLGDYTVRLVRARSFVRRLIMPLQIPGRSPLQTSRLFSANSAVTIFAAENAKNA